MISYQAKNKAGQIASEPIAWLAHPEIKSGISTNLLSSPQRHQDSDGCKELAVMISWKTLFW